MNKQAFQTWLKATIAELNRLDADPVDLPYHVFEEAADAVRQAGRQAALLGIASRCGDCDTPALALTTARDALAEVLAAVGSNRHSSGKSELLTVQEAATKASVSPKTIYALVASGKLRCQRIGNGRGTIRIRPTDLDRVKEPETHGFKHLRLS